MEKVKAEVCANYSDRGILPDNVEVGFCSDVKRVFFNIYLSEKRSDDYVTITCRVDDLMHAIGKAIHRELTPEE